MKTIELTFRRWLSVGPWDVLFSWLFCWINVSGACEEKVTGELFEQAGSLRRTGSVITAECDWRPGKGSAEAVLQFSELSGQIVVMSLNESESNSLNSELWDPSLTFSCGFGLRAVSSTTLHSRQSLLKMCYCVTASCFRENAKSVHFSCNFLPGLKTLFGWCSVKIKMLPHKFFFHGNRKSFVFAHASFLIFLTHWLHRNSMNFGWLREPPDQALLRTVHGSCFDWHECHPVK